MFKFIKKMMGRLSSGNNAKRFVTCRFSVWKRCEDGFAPLLKDGKETNVRLMIWERETVERLQRIAAELQNGR